MPSLNLKLNFMHGLGNQFVVIDLTHQSGLTKNQINSDLIKKIMAESSDYQIDQLLFLADSSHQQADFDYLIFNQDGRLAEQCGNGARAIAKYIFDNHSLNKNNYQLQLPNGNLMRVEYFNDNKISAYLPKENDSTEEIGLNLNQVQVLNHQKSYYAYTLNALDTLHPKKLTDFKLQNLPNLAKQINFYSLSMGNPHMIINIKELEFLGYPKLSFENLKIEPIAQILRQDKSLFLNGVNINFVEIVNRATIKLRTYERGVGETLACGSGAAASFAALEMNQLVEKKIKVQLKLGDLWFERTKNDEIQMQGPAQFQESKTSQIEI